MKAFVFIVLNLSRVGLFAFLFTRRLLLTYQLKDRRVWLTRLSIGAITLENLVPVRTEPILEGSLQKNNLGECHVAAR